MNKPILTIALALLIGCATQKSTPTASTSRGDGDTRTKEVEYLNEDTYLLTERSQDKTYGYHKSNPVKVGGSREQSGPRNERRYLNALLGPNGEEVKYYRAGSCCHFKTPNGLFDNTGLLDHYRISWAGSKDTLDIFINMYDKGDLQIPVGLTARTK